MIFILCLCLCPALLALVIGVLSLFVPLGYVCYFFAWFAGLTTVLAVLASLSNFDITDAEDWKMLAFSLLIPGSLTFLLLKLGDFLDTHHIFELLQLIKSWFS